MRIEYTTDIVAICPVDGLPDVYNLTVRTTRVIKVEDILAALSAVVEVPRFQEDLTQQLHRILACDVETVGYHSGVRTVVRCEVGCGVEREC